jgi:predicted nuclease of predicted toxin-antitoxin system
VRFLVDESTGPAVATWLQEQGHKVFSVYDESRGMEDIHVIEKAFQEDWVLVTNDKDFGEKVYREQHRHRGVILLRLEDERPQNKIRVMGELLEHHLSVLSDRFVVVTERSVRFARI